MKTFGASLFLTAALLAIAAGAAWSQGAHYYWNDDEASVVFISRDAEFVWEACRPVHSATYPALAGMTAGLFAAVYGMLAVAVSYSRPSGPPSP